MRVWLQSWLSALMLCVVILVAGAIPLGAELPELGVEIGRETGLPMPRFVSLKTSEAYARRGPSFIHRVDWVYTQRDLPVLITAEHGHWRRVEDLEGQGGWVHYTLLSGVRSVIVTTDELALHHRPDAASPLMALLKTGRVARIARCTVEWCQIIDDGRRGWVRHSGLWGVAPGEVVE